MLLPFIGVTKHDSNTDNAQPTFCLQTQLTYSGSQCTSFDNAEKSTLDGSIKVHVEDQSQSGDSVTDTQ